MRGCFTLLLGFVLGIALMLYLWPRTPPATRPPSQPADVRVLIADTYLAHLVQQRASTISAPSIQNVTVSSSPPNILNTSADVAAGPLSAPVTLQIQPLATNGSIQLHVVSAQVGAVPVPPQLAGLVIDAINSTIQRQVNANAQVTAVTVTAGGLEIYANYR